MANAMKQIKLRKIQEANVRDKFVLVRTDFNVPLKDGKILDDSRIRAALPTINYLRKKGAKIVLMSHLGRPDGNFVANLSLKPVARRLSELLRHYVEFVTNYMAGDGIGYYSSDLYPGDVLLLENLRFYPEEELNGSEFAKELAAYANIYVDDAFGAMHRAHASITGVTRYLPSYAGLLVQKEVENLSKLKHAKHPFTAIIGGAKTDKLGLIRDLLKKVDYLVVGGLLANVLLKARGEKINVTADKKILSEAKKFCNSKKLILPVDFAKDKTGKIATKDIGPKTIELIKDIVKKSKTIFWAGPLGVIEERQFRKGTYEIARAIAKSKAFTVIGGGTSAEVVFDLKLEKKFSWVSTGGGASIAFVQGKSLPGLEVLRK